MGNNIQYYQFTYNGNTTVYSGSKMIFSGEFFDLNGNRDYKAFCPCTFKYVQGDKYYIEVDGKLCWSKDFKRKIERFTILNGEKIPNPITEDEVKSGRILLLLIMAVTTIFNGNVFLWILELIIYHNWANHKKYD